MSAQPEHKHETIDFKREERRKQPLASAVKTAMDIYFSHLGGHEATGLYTMVMEEVERPLLESVLEYYSGNQSKAAEALGLNRGTLRKKLKQHGLLGNQK
jgi:Fis family transcriptional regulator, factor for inversion stimulation protein